MLIKLLSLPLSQEVLFSYVTFRQIYVFCMAINSCNNLQLVLAALVAATMIVAAAFALTAIVDVTCDKVSIKINAIPIIFINVAIVFKTCTLAA